MSPGKLNYEKTMTTNGVGAFHRYSYFNNENVFG